MKIFKHIVNWIVWTVLGLYALTMVAVHTPWVQQHLGQEVAQAVGRKLGTKVSIGRIDLGFLNRLILDNVVIYDQQQRVMLRSARLSAKINVTPLIFGRISISSAQVFETRLNLTRPNASSPANYQFVIDSLASSDTTRTPLDLRINSLIMRHSSVSYNQLDAAQTPGRLNPLHLNVIDISAHVILKALTDDSIDLSVKRLTFFEKSGAKVNKLAFRLVGNRQQSTLTSFLLQMPRSELHIDSLKATYDNRSLQETLRLGGILSAPQLSPADFGFLLPPLRHYPHQLSVATRFHYGDSTLTVPQLNISSTGGDFDLHVSGIAHNHPHSRTLSWSADVDRFMAGAALTDYVSHHITPLPHVVQLLGNVDVKGTFSGDNHGTLNLSAAVSTDAGHLDTRLEMTNGRHFKGNVSTADANLRHLLGNDHLGLLATEMDVSGTFSESYTAKGHITKIDYDGNSYQNIELDGRYANQRLSGWLHISDPKLAAELEADIEPRHLNDAVGIVSLRNLRMPEKDYELSYLRIESGYDADAHHVVTLNSDFAHAELTGDFNFATLPQSLTNAIGSKLPTLPVLPPMKETTGNDFTLKLNLGMTDWLVKLLDIPLSISRQVTLDATVNDHTRSLTVDMSAPAFDYDGNSYRNCQLHISSPADTLFLNAALSRFDSEGHSPFDLTLDANAVDNNLSLRLGWNNNSPTKPVNGLLNADAQLYRNLSNDPEAHFRVRPSIVYIDQTPWQVEPSDLLYTADRLLVDHFTCHNGSQYITVDGSASKQDNDTITVSLKGVEVAYILDLIGFDAVTFAGKASGTATLTSAFVTPNANAVLHVDDFLFQDGRMGTLNALVNWDKELHQIDIHARANDGPDATTDINGYVSIEKEYIDLGIDAHGTYLDFMHSFTKSFISDITGHGYGQVRLAGPLDAINLTGNLIVDAQATITPLGTTYQLRRDTLTLVYNEIMLNRQPIYDKHDNVAFLTGAIHHQDLTNLSLDLHVNTDRFLGYDFNSFGDQSFYGTVFAAGNVDISMKGDDVHIDCDVTPLANTVFTYNTAQNDAITNQDFITWRSLPLNPSRGGKGNNYLGDGKASTPLPSAGGTGGEASNIYMTFLINTTPEATMRLLMDPKTGDYITLAGNGTLQASYYNKGTFQMQGTYTVDNGTYDITIQQIINKKFQFQRGGTIVFGGDPYDAALNLKAMYTVNGVSLSDLNIGNTFSSNTVRVNCLMNISGQPRAPQVDFDLEMPTVNADEQQMVRSLLSSQQEMNQQVLYLLGIGRFYSQGQNNADEQQQDQTALAMQSFLSGTLSTQINNVLNQVIKNDSWNFGANISTGTEGWNNAEYEGIVNGSMLNNRLLINGQFGYRDNATKASPSFIGDFDVRYLLTPNGNYALKVYNQTNDRYFTRSSLNTQGIGIIMKKDFNGLSDFFNIKKK